MFALMFFIWLVIAGIFLLLELAFAGLFFYGAFAIGALAGGVVAWWSSSIIVQLCAFLGIACAAFVFLQYFLRYKNYFLPKHAPQTNVYSLLGKKGIVVCHINPAATGYVQVDGQQWAARADEHIAAGRQVLIIEIKGCHLIVRPLFSKDTV